jgi:hypothetical protein
MFKARLEIWRLFGGDDDDTISKEQTGKRGNGNDTVTNKLGFLRFIAHNTITYRQCLCYNFSESLFAEASV